MTKILFFCSWMDGAFQSLEGESMEVEVDKFFREVSKMVKFFQQRQSKAAQELERKPRRKPGQEDPSKLESPTVILCSSVLQEIKEFKVGVKPAHCISQKIKSQKQNSTIFFTGACSTCVCSVQSGNKTKALGPDV